MITSSFGIDHRAPINLRPFDAMYGGPGNYFDGITVCEHDVVRGDCEDCSAVRLCEHGRVKYQCTAEITAAADGKPAVYCGGTGICEHGRAKSTCTAEITAAADGTPAVYCGGTGICEHGRVKSKCTAEIRAAADGTPALYCGSGVCEHGREKSNCARCDAAVVAAAAVLVESGQKGTLQQQLDLALLFVCPLCDARLGKTAVSLDQHLRSDQHELNMRDVNRHIEECKVVKRKLTTDLRTAIKAERKRETAVPASEPKLKRQKTQVDITGIDWAALLQSGKIRTQTGDVLRAYCEAHGLPKTGSKKVLVDRVTERVTAMPL
jgi:hypothetical protein